MAPESGRRPTTACCAAVQRCRRTANAMAGPTKSFRVPAFSVCACWQRRCEQRICGHRLGEVVASELRLFRRETIRRLREKRREIPVLPKKLLNYPYPKIIN